MPEVLPKLLPDKSVQHIRIIRFYLNYSKSELLPIIHLAFSQNIGKKKLTGG